MLEVLGQAQKLGTVAPGNKPGKGLAELVRAEPPGFPIMIGDADMPRKVIDAPGDMHVRHRHDLAILRVLHQEQIVAARGFAQRRAQLLEQLHRAHDRCRGNPALPTAIEIVDSLEQPGHDICLINAGSADRVMLDCPCFH